ncbi:MAG: insulinase family protein, partial [Opitutales bacterium]
MLRVLRLLACLIFAFGLVASATRAARPFPQASSDLAPDPAAHFGTLPNGLRYVILPHHEPNGRLSLRLLVESGSFMEEENQRGLAHFLEHMAFKGSTHYAPGTLVEFFQRMGMSFGGDTNASTSFDQTVYELELPDTKDATLREGFQVFADFAGGLLLEEKEIDSERGVILSEKRTRDNVDFRTFVAEANFVYAGTRLPARIPIGQTDIVAHAQRPLFVDLYNTWYRPERMTVVAVGDADAGEIETRLAAAFAGVTDRAPARPEPGLGTVKPFQGLRVKYCPEPEAAATTLSLQVVAPYTPRPDTAAERRKYLPRDLAVAMLNRRLAQLAKLEHAGFSNASCDADESFNFIHEASLEVTCKPDQWQKALRVGEHELRRALTYGFEPAELHEAKANFLNGLQQAVQTASTTPSPELASAIVGSLVDRQVFTSPAEDLALFGPALAHVTPEDCVEALREAWGGTGRYLLVSGNVVMPGDAAAAITAAYEAARAEPVTAPPRITTATFAYTHFGPPGTVVSRREVKDLGLTLVTFANGVRLNLKPTDFEAGQIRVNVRIGTGQLTEPPAEPGLSFVADNTFVAGGLVRHSADDLRRILAGRTVGVGFNVGG